MYTTIREWGQVPLLGGPIAAATLPVYVCVKLLIAIVQGTVSTVLWTWSKPAGKVLFTLGGWVIPVRTEVDPGPVQEPDAEQGSVPEGTPGSDSDHGSVVKQLADAKMRTQQWQAKRIEAEAKERFPIDVTDLMGVVTNVEVSLDTSVDTLRVLVHEQKGAEPDHLMLLVDNEALEDETLALGAYGLRRGLGVQLTTQDPTKAAMRRRLRQEGRKAAEAPVDAVTRTSKEDTVYTTIREWGQVPLLGGPIAAATL
eukprot:COSAG06_NODE_20516_length_792_cov_3.691198_1_plen_254_part_10